MFIFGGGVLYSVSDSAQVHGHQVLWISLSLNKFKTVSQFNDDTNSVRVNATRKF